MNPREMRGQAICTKQGQIERKSDTHYFVKSQSSDGIYDVISLESGWMCSCPDHYYRRVCCKHIHAVEISLGMREVVQAEIIIPQIDLGKCKFCDSSNIHKKGIKKAKKGNLQQFKCKDCGRRFVQNLGFERKRATPEQITMAVDLFWSGLSSRKTATTLKMTGVQTSHITVQNWADEYGTLMEKYLDKITPQVGENWRTDELYLKIKGDRKYLFAMLDSETRFWLAKMVATHKGNDDVSPMFKKAEKIAGKKPAMLISDGAANFHHAWKNQYRAKNRLHKETEHHRHVHLQKDMNNNQMESFNGNTLRHREKVIRGLKKEDSALLTGLQLYHNYVRPHQGLDGDTPADRAGIRIEGDNKWMTIIQNATKSTS